MTPVRITSDINGPILHDDDICIPPWITIVLDSSVHYSRNLDNIENLRILKENLPHKFSAWCYYSRAAPILEKEKNGATQKYAMFIRIANDFENVINFFQWRLSNVANVILSLMDYPDIWKMLDR